MVVPSRYELAVTSVIRTSKIVIRRSFQNPTTPLSPRLSSPGDSSVWSCCPPSAGSSPLAMWACVASSVASSLALLAPSPLPVSCLPVWILGLSETADEVRALPKRSHQSLASMLCRRVMSPPILHWHVCSAENGTPHPSQSVGRRRGLRPRRHQMLSQNSSANSSVSSMKLGMAVSQAPDLHARSICSAVALSTPLFRAVGVPL